LVAHHILDGEHLSRTLQERSAASVDRLEMFRRLQVIHHLLLHRDI